MRTLAQCKDYFRKKGIFDKVCQRIRVRRGISFDEAYVRYHYDMLNSGITWSDTPEGHNFWEREHDAFCDFWDHGNNIPNHELKFKEGQTVIIEKKLESEIVEITDEMNNLAGKKVTIAFIDGLGYEQTNKKQDGAYYYIKEDNMLNSWTSELLKK